MLHVRKLREALPRVIELHFSKLGFDIGSVCSFQVDGAASTCHVLLIYVHAFSLLLFVSPGGSKGLGLTLRSNYF